MLRLILILPVFLLLAPVSAQAQSCSFSVTNVNFGNVDTLSGAPVDTTASVDISCDGGLLGENFAVCLNINAGSGGATSGIRHMRNAANTILNYNLYQDASRTTPWGSREQPALGSPVALTLSAPPLGSASQRRTMYARVSGSQQSAVTGNYTSAFSGAETSFNWTTYLLTPPDCNSVTQNPVRPSFNVGASVVSNCTVAAQNIDFGLHGVIDAAVDATGELAITCTPGTAYSVGLNNGLAGDGPAARRMTLGGEAILYGLYKDAARSQPWGNSRGEMLSDTGARSTQSVPVYGRVERQPTPAPGTYMDTVVVTVTY